MELTRGRRGTALALSMLYPGLGHLYVRSWHRAVGWYLGGVAAMLAVAPDAVLEVVTTRSVDAMALAPGSLPVGVLVTILLGLRVLGAVDVWWLLRRRTNDDAVVRCGSCARARDIDVEFCPWCLDDGSGE